MGGVELSFSGGAFVRIERICKYIMMNPLNVMSRK